MASCSPLQLQALRADGSASGCQGEAKECPPQLWRIQLRSREEPACQLKPTLQGGKAGKAILVENYRCLLNRTFWERIKHHQHPNAGKEQEWHQQVRITFCGLDCSEGREAGSRDALLHLLFHVDWIHWESPLLIHDTSPTCGGPQAFISSFPNHNLSSKKNEQSWSHHRQSRANK